MNSLFGFSFVSRKNQEKHQIFIFEKLKTSDYFSIFCLKNDKQLLNYQNSC